MINQENKNNATGFQTQVSDNGTANIAKTIENKSITIEKDAVSSLIISGDGNKVVVYQSQFERTVVDSETTESIGPNPYKGLVAFYSEDSERYFGREKQIEKLWNLFRTLHENTTEPGAPLRLLPILGPSGCGKSSLARAGLIPELARRPLPGKHQARVAVFVPGAHPVEALATVLARIATNDQTPVAKTNEFEQVLKKARNNTYDGLRRIANVLPDIAVSPLVVLVDQFEEVYSLCKNKEERQIFIDNLIHAAGDSTGYVSIIITLRSDFLEEAQQHTALNQVIAAKNVIVPAMSEDELRRAITKPAENAGHPLDEAVVTLLLKDTNGREGALPLLQFALTRIWEGLKKGVEPVKTLRDIGGVGGALAQEAERIFDSLKDEEKKIARRVFLGLVQLGEGASDTRRRANIDNLVSYKEQPESVKRVIDKFAHPGVRLVTVSSEKGIETAEVTHEALFANWGKMREWLDNSRSDIRFGRRLEEAAIFWEENGHPEGNLWRNPDLDLLVRYYQRARDNMTPLQVEFFNASVNAVIKAEEEKKRQRQTLIGVLSTGLFLTTSLTGFAAYQWQNAEQGRIEQAAIAAKSLLSNYPVQGLVSAISLVKQSRSPLLNFPNQFLSQSVKDSLFSAVEISRETNLLKGHQNRVLSVAISTDGETIVAGGWDGAIRMWNRKGQPLAQPFKAHPTPVWSVAISTDGQTIITGGWDETIRMWNRKGQPLVQPFKAHPRAVMSVVISRDGQTVVSGGDDGTVRMWNRKGQPLAKPFKGHQSAVYSVAISTDGQTIVSGGDDGTVRMWNRKGQPLAKPFKGHQSKVSSVAISTDGQMIVSGGLDGSVRVWNRKGQPLAEPFKGSVKGSVSSIVISTDGQTIVSGDDDDTVKIWNREGQLLAEPFKGHQDNVSSVAISKDGQTIVSGGWDGTVRIWNRKGQPSTKPFKGHQSKVSSVAAISTDGQTIVSGEKDGTVRMWNRKGQPLAEPFKGHRSQVFSVAISTDGETIVSGGEDGTVRIWNRKGQTLAEPFKGHRSKVFSVAISTDGQTIVSGGEDGTVRIWNRKGQPLAEPFKGHQILVTSVAISTDGQTIVSGGKDGTVRIWNRKGQPLSEPFKGHQNVYSVAISADGQTIVSGGRDGTNGTVRIWNRKGQSLAEPFQSHQMAVQSVAISTDGQTIVSGGLGGTVRMWNRKGQSLGHSFKGHELEVSSVAISTDGQTIISGGDNGIKMWDIKLDTWLKIACERLRYHPVLQNPESTVEKEAKRTCEPYLRVAQKN
jgi:WD40 repeat protein